MTHLDDADLSALIDRELEPAAAAAARAHAASCAECRARMERLRGAAAAFRRSGARPMPGGLAARVKAAAASSSGARRRWVLALASLILALAAGLAAKRLLPGLLAQIQGMISGAAGSMGSGR